MIHSIILLFFAVFVKVCGHFDPRDILPNLSVVLCVYLPLKIKQNPYIVLPQKDTTIWVLIVKTTG